jgi:hypothetical protein
MRNNKEYQLYKQLAIYLKYQYPGVLYHYDPTGLNLSKAQSGMLKGIQAFKGYPDLQILEKRGNYGSLFIELKPDGTELFKKRLMDKNGYPMWASEHIREQHEMLTNLTEKGFKAEFAIGFDEAKELIDNYLKLK